MQLIFMDDFNCNGCTYEDIFKNLSQYCHYINEEISIYKRSYDKYLICVSNEFKFPNVVYVQDLHVLSYCSIPVSFPDLRKVGKLNISKEKIDHFGKINEINNFSGLDQYFYFRGWAEDEYPFKCTPLGDDMYRFTSRKGTWDIKVNSYD
jgi:hypothetical protein